MTRTLQRPTVNICRARKKTEEKERKRERKRERKEKRENVKTLESFIRMVLYLRFSL